MFGDYTLMMEPIGSFSVCYLFKGQSYVAKQKLLEFTERLHSTISIWQDLMNFNETHQPLVINENPPLKTLLTEIFIDESH